MAGLSFSVFKNKILNGSKRQTIRGIRKHPIKEGEKLFLWWKQRSPHREKLGEAKCIKVLEIKIFKDEVRVKDESLLYRSATYSTSESLNKFAIADGFNNWQELVEFFESTHGLPFTGVLIQWDSIKAPF
jgi:hypothetical protein